ncbi:hypothetical protein BC938DRAFT_480333 [Jimgerdemannia flammicorona]|uniref:SET domain-containing protein n=1 Tax=Jimgerdemannia flammicorona TaxID=994334 RepID=A0A433R0F6_9FUNG|nr:hypothetical protein BC938DRAFT_480333 [Jimgerdemannia flammicorona]
MLLSQQDPRQTSTNCPDSSKTPFNSLERISLFELRLNTIHLGRVLVCRTISKPIQSAAVHVEIEDPIIGERSSAAQETDVTTARLPLYNFNVSGVLGDVLDIGTRLFIRKPYCEFDAEDGLPMLRCYSPDDVVLVPNEQVDGPLLTGLRWSNAVSITYGPPVKQQSRPRSGKIDDLQRRGNEQFIRKEYASAIDSYTQALELEPDDVALLSNRAHAHLQLQQFRKALQDAEAALKLDGANPKARFRQAKALYAMRSYEEAWNSLKMLSKATVETQELSRRTRQRLEEQKNGRYNVMSILHEARSTWPPYLDHSDYVGPMRVTEIPGKGRGMVATKEIAEGSLLMCSKAFAVVFEEKSVHDIVIKIVDKLKKEPWVATELYDLYAGPNMPPMSTNCTNATEAAEIDIARITNIVIENSFTVDKELWTPLSSQLLPHANRRGVLDVGTGLWILPSLINHSCLANASFFNIGDFMFIRAVRDLNEGEEVCVAYVGVLDTYEGRTKKLEKRNFECHCPLCDFERAQPEATCRRAKLLDEFTRMRPEIQMGNVGKMPRLKVIMDEIRKTYSTASATISTSSRRGKKGKKKVTAGGVATTTSPPAMEPHQLPIGLFRTLSAYSHLNACLGQFNQAVQALHEAFEVLPRIAGVNFVRVDIAMQIGKMYGMLNRFDEVGRWKKVARKEFQMLYGEDQGLWKEYVDDFDVC